MPSNRFNCADDCSLALELDPLCAPAYTLRAQSRGDISHPSRISGRWPSRAALDYLSAYALDSSDTTSRTAFLKICTVIFKDKTSLELTEELDALGQMLAERIGAALATLAMNELSPQIEQPDNIREKLV